FLKKQPIDAVLVRHAEKFEIGKLWQVFRQSHVRPNNTAAFDAWVTGVLHFILKLLVLRYIRHLDTLAVRRIFPGVIGAAQPVRFDSPEIERRETVRAEGADK